VDRIDSDQLKFVEILAKLMAEHELFRDSYSDEDFADLVTWLRKLRTQIDITLELLEQQHGRG
jgi:hypothetical protein